MRASVGGSALVLAALCLGCPSPPQEDRLETVDVGAAPDAQLDPESDRLGKRSSEGGLSGVLPSDFPATWPLPLPASVLDLGESADGYTVELLSRRPLAELLASYPSEIAGAGWHGAPPLAARQAGLYRLGGVSVRVEASADGSNCRLQLAYRGR